MKYKIIIIALIIILIIVSIINIDKIKLMYFVATNDFDIPELEIVEAVNSELNISLNDRFWLHRVNSIQKLKHAMNKYSGIEVDMMYDNEKGVFDVRHWPEEKSAGLTFNEYLSHFDSSYNDIKIWVDFKNLSELSTNKTNEAINRMFLLSKEHDIPITNFIIESQDPDKLHLFIKKGFMCSYWIPHIKINLLSQRDIEIWYNQVAKIIVNNKISILSCDVSMLPLVNEYFPNIQHMVWGVNSNLTILLIDEVKK